MEKTKGRFLYLFIVLIAILILYPYAGGSLSESDLLRILWALIPLTAIHAVGKNRRHLYFAVVFAGLIILSMVPGLAGLFDAADQVTAFLAVVFYIFVVVMLAHHIWKAKRVDADMLYGGVSIYILLGIIWAGLYREMEIISPGSFTGPDELTFGNLIYFSYVTLTTLGYGEIRPVTEQAQSLTILEAMTGVVFLGTLIARLVSMYKVYDTDDER